VPTLRQSHGLCPPPPPPKKKVQTRRAALKTQTSRAVHSMRCGDLAMTCHWPRVSGPTLSLVPGLQPCCPWLYWIHVPGICCNYGIWVCRSDEKGNVTDNAASSLGKVLEFHSNLADDALATTWLSALPLTHDTVEAHLVHEQLLRLVEKGDSRYLAFPSHAACLKKQHVVGDDPCSDHFWASRKLAGWRMLTWGCADVQDTGKR
jgi:hypothetical protein